MKNSHTLAAFIVFLIATVACIASTWITFYFADRYRCPDSFISGACHIYPIVPIWLTGGAVIVISIMVIIATLNAMVQD